MIEIDEPTHINTKFHSTFSSHYGWENFMKGMQCDEGNISDFSAFWIIFLEKIALWSELRKARPSIRFWFILSLGVKATLSKIFGVWGMGLAWSFFGGNTFRKFSKRFIKNFEKCTILAY